MVNGDKHVLEPKFCLHKSQCCSKWIGSYGPGTSTTSFLRTHKWEVAVRGATLFLVQYTVSIAEEKLKRDESGCFGETQLLREWVRQAGSVFH